MIDWITPIISGLVVIAICAALFFIYTAYVVILHDNEEKCPFCGKWTKDKGYRKQDCDHCKMETVYLEND